MRQYLLFFFLLLLASCAVEHGSRVTVTVHPRAQNAESSQQRDTAQQYVELEGDISDDQNSRIRGATVLVESTNRGALTNERGVFRVKKIPPGTYTVRVKSIGFEEAVQEIELTANTAISVVLIPEEVRYQFWGCPVYKPLADPEQIGTIRTISSSQLQRSPP